MQSASFRFSRAAGFTLIELSIVLVIIGLIVGSVLVGRDLIKAAEVRATISQIEKYNTAVNTFRGKFGALPGDLNGNTALQFGFAARGAQQGQGDGNGILEGNWQGGYSGVQQGAGETAMFWVDVSKAGLIESNFTTASATITPATTVQATGLSLYFPEGKLGQGSYIYVWSGGWSIANSGNGPASDNVNYFGIASIGNINSGDCPMNSALTVRQAYDKDKKIDDGLPQQGTVMAIQDGMSTGAYWASGIPNVSGDEDPDNQGPIVAGDGIATAGTSTTCYDNGNVAGDTEKYSLGQNGGAGVNCALSFKFQ